MGQFFDTEKDTSEIEQEIIRYDNEEEEYSIELIEYFLETYRRELESGDVAEDRTITLIRELLIAAENSVQ